MHKLLKFKENVSPIIVQAINGRWPDISLSNFSIGSVLKATETVINLKLYTKKKLNLKFKKLFSHCKESYLNMTKILNHNTHIKKAKKDFESRVLSLVLGTNTTGQNQRINEQAKIRNWISSFIKTKKKRKGQKSKVNTNFFFYQTEDQINNNRKGELPSPFSIYEVKIMQKVINSNWNEIKDSKNKLQNIINFIRIYNTINNIWIKDLPIISQNTNISQIKLNRIIKRITKTISIIKDKTNKSLINLNQKQSKTLLIAQNKKIKAKALTIAYVNSFQKLISIPKLLINNPYSLYNSYKNSILLNNQKNFLKTLFPFNSKEISHNNYTYNFKKQNFAAAQPQQKNLNIYSILDSFFFSMSSLISKPVSINSPLQLKILLFFYWLPLPKKNSKYLRRNKKNPNSPVKFWNENTRDIFIKKKMTKHYLRKLRTSKKFSKFFFFYKDKLENLLIYLNKFFKKPIEMELIRLHHPHFDSNILINLIGFLISNYKFRTIWNFLISYAKVNNPTKMVKKKKRKFRPSYLSGIGFKLAGRIDSKSLKIRAKSRLYQIGSLAREKANIVTFSRFTHKNKVGAFSITLNTGHLIVD